jgi:hypothetical protein
MASTSSLAALAAAFAFVAPIGLPVYADDGVVLINQSKVSVTGGFPYKITSAVSYRLAGNLTVTTAVDGIDVTDSSVVGYGTNVIDTGGTTCFSGGTSLGENVCDGTR